MSASTTYKLHYFDGRGRGEAIRLIFVLGNEKFEDRRYDFDEWPKYKPNMPLGQLPVLGKFICLMIGFVFFFY